MLFPIIKAPYYNRVVLWSVVGGRWAVGDRVFWIYVISELSFENSREVDNQILKVVSEFGIAFLYTHFVQQNPPAY